MLPKIVISLHLNITYDLFLQILPDSHLHIQMLSQPSDYLSFLQHSHLTLLLKPIVPERIYMSYLQ